MAAGYIAQIESCAKVGLGIPILYPFPDPFTGTSSGQHYAPRILIGQVMQKTNNFYKIRLPEPFGPIKMFRGRSSISSVFGPKESWLTGRIDLRNGC